jgi:SsrA-binding protein
MKIVAKNKRATYDYDISERLVAGIVLAGHEVKSVKAGHISLKGSFISIHEGEPYLVGAHITQYKHAANIKGYDPEQSRKILLHRRQIDQIIGAIQSQGMTVVPIVVGIERGLVKVEVGIGRGKKRFDKRETIKKRDMLRDADRDIRSKDK